jgi:anti-sigma factor RsiW
MKNPAREKFLPLLSPYVDGELSPQERQLVEQHLANNRESAGQVADFRAADALVRHAFEMRADEIDWKDFSDSVMSKVTPEKLPFWEGLRVAWSERLTYQRGPVVAGLIGAAAAVAIAVPLSLNWATPEGYGANQMKVQRVSVEEDATFKPVVMETESGDAIIWVMEASPDGGKKKKDGEHTEETVQPEPESGGEL